MLGNAPGNSTFDGLFLLAQLIAFTTGVGALWFGKQLASWSSVVLVVVAGLLAFVSPIAWYMVSPPRGGIDKAGFLLYCLPSVLINALVIGTAIERLARK